MWKDECSIILSNFGLLLWGTGLSLHLAAGLHSHSQLMQALLVYLEKELCPRAQVLCAAGKVERYV